MSLPALLRGYYQLQDCEMTLQQGLEEYWRVNGLDDTRQMEDPSAAAYFTSHDACHVIFGTHTGDLDEACNDLYTWMCCDVDLLAYVVGFLKTEQAKPIKDHFFKWQTLRTIWRSLLLIPALWRLSRSVHPRWRWIVPPAFFDRPLIELRAEHGIKVVHPEAMWRGR